ncbi:MAG: S41 family peptidase [Minicystis sp.]
MLPAANRGVGMNLGFPDVCNTPTPAGPVPIPYPNIAMNAQATPFSPVVRICMMAALNMGSKIPMTSGDEAGSASPIKGAGAYTMGCPNVNIDSLPAITLLCPTTGNNMNNALGAVLVPSLVNVFFSYRPSDLAPDAARGRDRYTRETSAEDLAALHDEVIGGGEAESRQVPLRGAMLPGGVGVLAIGVFTPDLPERVYSEIQRLEEDGMESLVLDLRGNPGGDVEAFLRVAEDFLPEGMEMARAIEDDGDEVIHRARQDGAYGMPLVVLVDGQTASAAELLAGCLQAHGRAVVVGERTYGKGVAQRIVPAASGPGIFCATVARYQLPDGGEIEGIGIQPDVTVASSTHPSSTDIDADAALRAAWERASRALNP